MSNETAHWLTVNAERALYVDRGREVILCDRLASPVTLVLKLNAENLASLKQSLSNRTHSDDRPATSTGYGNGANERHHSPAVGDEAGNISREVVL